MSLRFCLVLATVLLIAGIVRAEAIDALDEVNAARRLRGLRPFAKDANLTAGAMQAAKIRAANGIHGHLSNDFHCLPVGTTAAAAGCGVEYPGFGWLSCCTYDAYAFAGAAKARDKNGRWYYHLFVNGPQSQGGSQRVQASPVPSRYDPARRRR